MKKLRCLLHRHPWLYDFNPASGTAYRGCPDCGKIQHKYKIFWYDWATGWTWKKWLDEKTRVFGIPNDKTKRNNTFKTY